MYQLRGPELAETTKIWVCSLVCNYMFLGQNLVFTKGRSQKVGVQLHTLHTRFRRPCMRIIQISVPKVFSAFTRVIYYFILFIFVDALFRRN